MRQLCSTSILKNRQKKAPRFAAKIGSPGAVVLDRRAFFEVVAAMGMTPKPETLQP